MPRVSPLICVGSLVSVVPKFLRDTGLLNFVSGTDINRRGCRFKGTITEIYEFGGKQYAKVTFEIAPDASYNLLLTCLKFEGVRPRRPVQQVDSTALGDPDLLEDAIQDADENDSSDEVNEELIVDLNWREGGVFVDERAANPLSAYRNINPIINMNGAAFASPARYFLHFLPCNHLKSVVIPAINGYASSQLSSWIALDWPEYLTWVMLWIKMTVIACRDMSIYWKKSSCPYSLNVDFGDYMAMSRFKAILKWHIFVTPNGSL